MKSWALTATLSVCAMCGTFAISDPVAARGRIATFDISHAAGGTFPQSINDAGTIAGYFRPNAEGFGGFVRAADGTITKFKISRFTMPLSINAAGDIAGRYRSDGSWHAFLRTADGATTTFDPPNASQRRGSGVFNCSISDDGEVAGSFGDSTGGLHGYVRESDGTIRVFDPPGSTATWVASISSRGDIAGWYQDANNARHGFLWKNKKTFFEFDASVTLGTATNPASVNAKGVVAGYYFDKDYTAPSHGFIRSPDGTITIFDAPNAGTDGTDGTLAFSVNDKGEIAGEYRDDNYIIHAYVRSTDGTITSFDPSGSTDTSAVSINTRGTTVGMFVDGLGRQHGFVRSR